MATTNDLSVINAAAGRTGNTSIASLTEGSVVANVASSNYEESVKAALASYPWKRATKIASLNRLDPDAEGVPPAPWGAAYQLPEDLIEIRSVGIGGHPIDYAVHGNKILCNTSANDDVVLTFLWRVPEAQWPAWFREGMTRRWEAILLRATGERYGEANSRDKAAEEQFALARARDSQSQTARDPVMSPTLRARGGYYSPFGNDVRYPPFR